MEMAQILGVLLDKDALDALDLLLTEWFNKALREQSERAEQRGDIERYEQLEAVVAEHHSEDKKECEEFLNWMVETEGREKEELYLYGVRDGIRAARWFATI